MSVVLITVDTLRGDHLSYAGYARETTPLLDRRVADSFTVFEEARSTSSCSVPQFQALTLRSRPSAVHRWTLMPRPYRYRCASACSYSAR